MNITMISIWCQCLTAFVAAFSLIANFIQSRHIHLLSQAKEVTVWTKEKKLYISNHSFQALYNVFVFCDLNTSNCNLESHLDHIIKDNCSNYFYDIFPANTIESNNFVDNASAGNHHNVPAVLFTDCTGKQWYRKSNGALKKTKYITMLQKKGLLLSHIQ